ncbi:MAG TPA: acyl-CoA dehydrogenase [Candidatus Acidoferrales bacterium]|nr:acyl-CoA dehydrogenase [Candidatus Acidoferrales bacterium]
MDFELTEEQRMVQQTVRAFVEKEVKPVASQLDREGVYAAELVNKLAEIGLLGMFVPTEFGGSGMDYVCYILAMEEVAKSWASLGALVTVNNSLTCEPILRFGTEAQKRKYLPRLASGEFLGCYALTEPGAGSDAGSIQTRALPDGASFVLNGNKIFVTNGKHAKVAIVYAVTAPEQGKKGISAFLVEKDTPGFSVGKIEDKLGLRGSDTAELIFEDCRVPRENLLGRENEGFKIALATLDGGRIGIAAQAVGIAQGCLEEAIAHAKERRQFGRPIADFQAIQWMLADMATEIEAARLLTQRAAWLRQENKKVTRAAAMAKLFASETANRAAYKALQIFGGYGYIKDFPVERFFRDARITTLYEGTSEIQRLVIARELLREEGADGPHAEDF